MKKTKQNKTKNENYNCLQFSVCNRSLNAVLRKDNVPPPLLIDTQPTRPQLDYSRVCMCVSESLYNKVGLVQ